MGLFDFLKKKKQPAAAPIEPSIAPINSGLSINDLYTAKPAVNNPSLFPLVSTYREYVKMFMQAQLQGNYSPIAAYQKADGEIVGYLYVSEDPSYNMPIEQVLSNMEREFNNRLAQGAIRSYIILYHSSHTGNDDFTVAQKQEELRAIALQYKTDQQLAGKLALPYTFQGDELSFKGFAAFSKEENGSIMATQLEEGKDYFKERVALKAETKENAIGIKIKKANSGSMGDAWGGIFGYERLAQPNSRQLLMEYYAYAASREASTANKEVSVHELSYGPVIFRCAKKLDDSLTVFCPVVQTSHSLEVDLVEINEWGHVDNLEAVVSGKGRDTFGISFFATDYALNRGKYHSHKKQEVLLSAILFALDKSTFKENEQQDGPPLSDDFAMYMPHQEMAYLGCFNFVGRLESFHAVTLLDNGSIEGFLLRIKLINLPEQPDFFTIDMFVNKANMDVHGLEIGMDLTGLFQLQGQLKG